MHYLKILWAFSRPHTIIGSFVSIIALYCLTVAFVFPENAVEQVYMHWELLILTLISALACNIYITGLNQIQDAEIDAINKPWLPIPSGMLPSSKAKAIVAISLAVSLVSAAFVNNLLFFLIALIAALGTAYSVPPLKFKKHHFGAALSIILVRGILVNVGMPVQFIYALTQEIQVPVVIWPLVLFVVGFSLGIAWFKDIPDTKGDETFAIKTLAIAISPVAAFRYGIMVVSFSYIGLMVLAAFLEMGINQKFFFMAHCILLLAFLWGATKVKLDNEENLKHFYLRFWGFFFVEYIVYPLSFFL
jgi:homogentisate phytyltransferase / homogentisate geranylgeranyltransferase